MKLDSVKHIGIIGLGMIGDSLSVLTTGHGYRTTCLARNPDRIPVYKETYAMYFRQMIEQGLMPENQMEICEKYLKYTLDISDLKDCDIIFECVFEDIELKYSIYANIEANCPNVKAICSVSSSFVPDVLSAKATKYKDRIIVTHPFNPAHMVPFFELCGGTDTGEGVLEFAKEVLESLDRKPVILKKPAPGFIGNRLQFALWREALNLIESGICDPKDIDTCLNFSFCPRYTSIGIFEHFDNGGLNLNITTCNTVFPTLSNMSKAPPVITDRIARGDLGAKTGVGFYDWRETDMDAYRERVNAPYWRFINWDLPKE
ncbi:MAG: 3-hydroxyacyl-CoA dehydrogenase family protein [Clostridiales bacterium]|jgi:3-hydroxybutyryl-CoA dehydrogenase|nr:3-hydroxyacyl-CoA dehydrogenase family protein [Clostridiales bacterium]